VRLRGGVGIAIAPGTVRFAQTSKTRSQRVPCSRSAAARYRCLRCQATTRLQQSSSQPSITLWCVNSTPLPLLRRSNRVVRALGARDRRVDRCCCSLSCLDASVVRPACAIQPMRPSTVEARRAQLAQLVAEGVLSRLQTSTNHSSDCTHASAADRSTESAHSRCWTHLDTPPCMQLTGRGEIRCCCLLA